MGVWGLGFRVEGLELVGFAMRQFHLFVGKDLILRKGLTIGLSLGLVGLFNISKVPKP